MVAERGPDRACTDCGRPAPPETGDSTLISMKYGWRLAKETLPTGEIMPRWRCPACWKAYKARRA